MNNTLLFQWLFGGVAVFLYARERFDTPGPMRPTTTFTRYWMARVGYMMATLGLFLILGAATTDLPPGLASQFGMDTQPLDGLPGPVVAALILTSLLPRFPVLNKIDEAVKQWFQRIGNIPLEARELSGRIQSTPLAISPESLALLRPALADLHIEESWLSRVNAPCACPWTRSAVLYAIVKRWPQTPGYSRYVYDQPAQMERITGQIEALSSAGDAALQSFEMTGRPSPDEGEDKRLRKEIDALHRSLCDFIAGGVLQVGLSQRQRLAMLERLGFGAVPEPRSLLSVHEIILLAGLIFIGMLLIPLIASKFISAPLYLNMRVIVMVPMIYAVAIVAAIYPKAAWPIADVHAAEGRPYAGYFASGCLAAAAAFVVSLLLRYLMDFDGNVIDALTSPGWFRKAFLISVDRWPWLLMTFCATIAIAWTADNRFDSPGEEPRSLRVIEGISLAMIFALTQWVVLELLRIYSEPKQTHWNAPLMIIMTGIIGAILGYCVPHLYRTKRTAASRAVMPAGELTTG